MSNWKPGTRLQNGRYEINKVLGYGGSGITYRAKEYPQGNPVAIKTLNVIIQNQPDFSKHQERFIQEAFCLAKCNHPHVIKVHNVCQEQQLWCMVMDYIGGGTLRQYVNYKNGISEEEALKYIQQIGSALTYIHEQGFIHRDVKPGNIMLRKKDMQAILIDFGLAREFVQDKIQTHTNSRTESFAPLEQYELTAKRGAYTDVYALAATLYYVLTLQLPFPAPFRQQGATLIPPKQHNPDISDTVNVAILQGMELQPQKRPQSIQEWLKMLTEKQITLSRRRNLRNSRQVILNPARKEQLSTTMTSSFSEQYYPSEPTKQSKKETKTAQNISKILFLSNSNIDYEKLQEFLTLGNLKEADQETAKIILTLTHREKQGWIDQHHVENLPCHELQIINQLWYEGSNGRFGFSVQKKLYQKLGGKAEYNTKVWRDFGDKVGWRNNNNWLSYKDLNFNLWAPPGHLPMLGMQLWGFTGWLTVLINRLNICQIQDKNN
ncbi:serine/threonine protein kinase [Crocosphaera subtropica ATCC 51142]|uniref:Serine/threonine protein kinase n=1 Tax=Crocosphaera subtropica (strain ATCC 51142 / BH68) TaxID=43989 RepID=B1WVK0_CROS5|nr:serine/threonine-protein kinase [Crocosphaera subtropica]ACB50587.1 serine/threonine protein kinase [Crocosphaera subtropica ATCC 51142]